MLVTNSFTKLVSNDIRYFALQPLFWLACVFVPAVGYLFTVGLTADAPSFAVQLQFKYMKKLTLGNNETCYEMMVLSNHIPLIALAASFSYSLSNCFC